MLSPILPDSCSNNIGVNRRIILDIDETRYELGGLCTLSFVLVPLLCRCSLLIIEVIYQFAQDDEVAQLISGIEVCQGMGHSVELSLICIFRHEQ